jgi:hypothetical protein
MANDLVPIATEIVEVPDVPALLRAIRPAWQARDLIQRVQRLLPVDPSSACQRIFNAAIHDLREKVVIAGIDIAKEVAKEYKLPPIERDDDIEEYSTSRLIDLAYRMGLMTRPEWRRVSRVYEIRRDLEHEDDEYEATLEDCVYVFRTSIEVVLSRDPISLLRVTDVKEIVEQPIAAVLNGALLDDFEHAPQPRQEEISRFLVSVALDSDKPDLVRQNAHAALTRLEPLTQNQVKLKVGEFFIERVGRNPMSEVEARVAFAAGVFPLLKVTQRAEYFERSTAKLNEVTYDWTANGRHGDLLRSLDEVGGLHFVPKKVLPDMVLWMTLCYIGKPGGYGTMGRNRPVFYSNSAAHLIERLFADSAESIREIVQGLREYPDVKKSIANQHVARRFEHLIDMIES